MQSKMFMYYLLFLILRDIALECVENAMWKMKQSGLLFCDAHKQQMPFLEFEAADAFTTVCGVSTHGAASWFCTDCSQSLCDKCSIAHTKHKVMQLSTINQELDTQVTNCLETLYQHKQQTDANRTRIKDGLIAEQHARLQFF